MINMIDWKNTIKKTGKPKSYFHQYPKTRKLVYAICNNCNKSRLIRYCDYRSLCKTCSNKLRNKL